MELELDDDVALPILRIELDDLKMKSGKPFVAFVEKIPEEQMVDIIANPSRESSRFQCREHQTRTKVSDESESGSPGHRH
jgi:hypothetical protein